MSDKTKATFVTVNVASFDKGLSGKYGAYKEAQAKAKALREDFEAAFTIKMGDKLPAGQKLVFGYKFGQLAIAAVDPAEKKSTKPAFSF